MVTVVQMVIVNTLMSNGIISTITYYSSLEYVPFRLFKKTATTKPPLN
jgi:hypothetical protein